MSKLETLIDSIRNADNSGWAADQEFFESDIKSIMEKYAEWYAQQVIKDIVSIVDCGKPKVWTLEMISFMKLPEHEKNDFG